jgi:regulatory protein
MDDFEKFYKASIRFLSFRIRSEKEMREYLLKKKCNDLVAKRIIDSLKRDKFINDEEFVRMWVHSRLSAKPRAWRVVKQELKQKGIGEELIENLPGLPSQNDFNSALLLAEKKLRTIHDLSDKYKVREKLGRYLASRGFDWDTVKEAIDQVLAK